MKKFLVSAMVLILTVLFCSCGIPAQKQECFCIPENFVSDVFITKNGIEYQGKLEKQGGKYTLTVTSPEGISGLTVVFENGEFEVNYGEGEMTMPADEDFFLTEIVEFIESSSPDTGVECEKSDTAYIIKHGGWEIHFPLD